MDLDALLTHCRLADGRLVDIGIAGGHIATIGEDTAPSLSNRVPILDIGGDLVLPGLVDGHMHLDKTLMGLPWMPHAAGSTRTRRQSDRSMRGARHRASAHPCRHDLESRLLKPDGVLAARAGAVPTSPFRKAAEC